MYKQNTTEKWIKGCILPFPKKGDIGITKNYRGITFTAIVAKVFNALLFNRSWPEVQKFHGKNQNGFREINPQLSNYSSNLPRNICKEYFQRISMQHLFVDFSKTFDSIHKGKME